MPADEIPAGWSQHNFQLPDELWDRCQQKAHERMETMSDVVRQALRQYANTPASAESAAGYMMDLNRPSRSEQVRVIVIPPTEGDGDE